MINKKKNYLISLFIVLLFIGISMRVRAQDVIATSGDYYAGSSGSVSCTIGEPVVETYSVANNVLTQGFNQTKLIVTNISESINLQFVISVIPNPATEYVRLIVQSNDFANLNYLLYDLNGNILQSNKLDNVDTKISFANLASSVYLLKIIKKDNISYQQEVKTFKIVKN